MHPVYVFEIIDDYNKIKGNQDVTNENYIKKLLHVCHYIVTMYQHDFYDYEIASLLVWWFCLPKQIFDSWYDEKFYAIHITNNSVLLS